MKTKWIQIKKKSIIKEPKMNRVNMQTPQLESWDQNNFIKSKSEKVIKFNFQSNSIWKDEIKKSIKKREKKKTRVNSG
jgi:hypothetical protein